MLPAVMFSRKLQQLAIAAPARSAAFAALLFFLPACDTNCPRGTSRDGNNAEQASDGPAITHPNIRGADYFH